MYTQMYKLVGLHADLSGIRSETKNVSDFDTLPVTSKGIISRKLRV